MEKYHGVIVKIYLSKTNSLWSNGSCFLHGVCSKYTNSETIFKELEKELDTIPGGYWRNYKQGNLLLLSFYYSEYNIKRIKEIFHKI